MRRLGCLTPLGLIAGLITVLIVVGVALAGQAAMRLRMRSTSCVQSQSVCQITSRMLELTLCFR